MSRHTVLVTSPVVRREAILDAARRSAHGRQVLSPAQAAARLAGGFLQGIERDALQSVLQEIMQDPALDVGDLQEIRELPGLVRALTATLNRVWLAGIDLRARAAATGNPRMATLAGIEGAARARVPPAMLTPPQLVACALQRIGWAPRLLGPITVTGVPDLDPVWRPLMQALADVVPIHWGFGQVPVPEWVRHSRIEIATEGRRQPAIARVSCANPRHEALEALRWARVLLASGKARPEQITIAATTTAEWDAHFCALATDADIPLAFVQGRPALVTREGQAAAALAEVLLGGMSQHRVARLLDLTRGMTQATRHLPSDWQCILPKDAPLLTIDLWKEVLSQTVRWPGGRDFAAELQWILEQLSAGITRADEIGECLLSGGALAIWRKALREGPAEAIDVSITGIRVVDETDPCTSILWCTAADAAASPRAYVRLLGLTSRSWPRTQSEDPLLPSHHLDPALLNPVPIPERDRRDFRTLMKAVPRQVVLSYARRGAEGRQTGPSALLTESGAIEEAYLARERIPEQALSESDRLLARPAEFSLSARAISARTCWSDWFKSGLTSHDGLVRPEHPVLIRVLARRFSATALEKLARDPLGFVWKYAFAWDAPSESETPLVLDPAAFGSLLHRVLELAVGELETRGGFARTDPTQRAQAVVRGCEKAAAEFAAGQAIPPRLLWLRALEEVRAMAEKALAWDESPLSGQVSFTEVPFGDPRGQEGHWPWDPARPVHVSGTDLAITGRIDRLDLSADRSKVRVTDYKTGKPGSAELQVAGGSGLQRCLYAYAVQSLLGARVQVDARLLYLRDTGALHNLSDAATTLERTSRYLLAARDHVRAGHCVMGPGTGSAYNSLAFALPGNAMASYLARKQPAADACLAPLPEFWDMP